MMKRSSVGSWELLLELLFSLLKQTTIADENLSNVTQKRSRFKVSFPLVAFTDFPPHSDCLLDFNVTHYIFKVVANRLFDNMVLLSDKDMMIHIESNYQVILCIPVMYCRELMLVSN